MEKVGNLVFYRSEWYLLVGDREEEGWLTVYFLLADYEFGGHFPGLGIRGR